MSHDSGVERRLAGWREWVSLPELGIPQVRAKLDTGARTSALHAFQLEYWDGSAASQVRFSLHTDPASDEIVSCTAEVIDERWVTDSGGRRERRPVIRSMLMLGGEAWPIEITLTDRETLSHRMLIGRTAMQGRLLVDPNATYLLSRSRKTTRRDTP